jgi:uncharacterized membrane protein
MIAAGSAGLCIVLAAVLRPGADPAPAFITFFGRFHTLALHLPIGVLLLIATAEAMALLPRFRKTIDPVLGLALPFFVVSGFAAFLLGLLLAKSGGYPVKLVALHRTLTLAGILLGAAATFAWTYRHKADGTVRRMPYQAALGLTVLLLTAGAHQGGSMTHGEDFLFRYAPEPVQKLAGFKPKPAATEEEKPAAVAEPLVFDSVVLPILKKKCGECHADGAAKGDLRLHTYAAIMKGGEHGAAVLPGQGSKSPLVVRLMLPKDNDEHMPPEGKPALTEGEIALIRWWIDRGASETLKVRDTLVPEAARSTLGSVIAPANGATESKSPESSSPAPAVPPSASSQPAPAAPSAAVSVGAPQLVYRDMVAPMLAAQCGACHSAGKQKGKLRTDSVEALLAGGKSGPAIAPGKPGASALLARMRLASSDDKHMPPVGEPQPSSAQIELLSWWIEQGAGVATSTSALPARLSHVGATAAKAAPPKPAATATETAAMVPSNVAPTTAATGVPAEHSVALYSALVAPILKRQCGACHTGDEVEGGLRVTDRKGMIDSRDLVPGDPSASPLLKRMELPLSSDLHMPPGGKDQVPAAEIEAVRAWILAGATEDLVVDRRRLSPAVAALLGAPAAPAAARPTAQVASQTAPAVSPGATVPTTPLPKGCGACAVGSPESHGDVGGALGACIVGLAALAARRNKHRSPG